jgi:tRNA uridine 5-carboxymethylaminomethyl modification enzyme
MYNGKVDSLGPRYCPSIEDKVMRFADKKSHQIFLEPETLSDFEVYPNGLSTSLPVEIQENFLRTIKGLENCIITQPGYAIEYSFFEPTCLNSFLETKKIKSLFFAGQINGTTGYEEAAAQGVLAGINASCVVRNINMWSPKRNESYLGVMVDDLITHGVTEPYRMFTSRAEHRLRLREDNADERLTEIGFNLGVVNEERFNLYKKKVSKIQKESERLEKIKIMPDSADSINLENKFNIKLKETQTMKSLLKKSDIGYQDLCELETFGLTANSDIGHLVAINERYSGYLKRQDKEIAKMSNDGNIKIPNSLVYSDIKALSNEAIEKLKKVSPKDLGQASRIAGVTPAMISLLRIYIKKHSIN